MAKKAKAARIKVSGKAAKARAHSAIGKPFMAISEGFGKIFGYLK